MTYKELREKLADLEHQQWAQWAQNVLDNPVDDARRKRGEREIKTDYEELSEKEKDFDREWADKILEMLKEENILQDK